MVLDFQTFCWRLDWSLRFLAWCFIWRTLRQSTPLPQDNVGMSRVSGSHCISSYQRGWRTLPSFCQLKPFSCWMWWHNPPHITQLYTFLKTRAWTTSWLNMNDSERITGKESMGKLHSFGFHVLTMSGRSCLFFTVWRQQCWLVCPVYACYARHLLCWSELWSLSCQHWAVTPKGNYIVEMRGSANILLYWTCQYYDYRCLNVLPANR